MTAAGRAPDNRFETPVALELLLDDIRALVAAPVTGERQRFLDDLERTLTDGYAHALALESQRLQLERRRGELLGTGVIDELTQELAALTTRIMEADERLADCCRTDALDQLLDRRVLEQIAAGPRHDRVHHVAVLVGDREHDDSCQRREARDAPRRLDTAHAGHVQIHNDHLGGELADEP